MRFMTYNIRRAWGSDGAISLPRIGRVIASEQPDVVGLNEVWLIPRFNDQPRRLARQLGMHRAFQSNLTHDLGGRFGNLVLCRGEILGVRDEKLGGIGERRGALFVEMLVDNVRLVFVTTHLGLRKAARRVQIARLAAELPEGVPLVCAGDMNARVEELEPLLERLHLAPIEPTYPALRPRRTLDYMLYSDHWRLREVHTLRSVASDHLPLIADLELLVPERRAVAPAGSSVATSSSR